MSRRTRARGISPKRHQHPIRRWQIHLILVMVLLLISSGAAIAQEIPWQDSATSLRVAIDTVWVLFTASLVFFMNAGFAMLETGFCRSKNATNVLAKNLIVFGIVTLAFWAVGFGLMFGDGNAVIGLKGFFLSGLDTSPLTGEAYRGIFSALDWVGVPLDAKFFFQLVFAGTAATIVSGAVAERIHFFSFFVFSAILSGLIYPIVGHWVWGGGFLQQLGFYDFAGTMVVHFVGGCAALIGAWRLGPRRGRYGNGPNSGPIPGHNLAIATLGGMILWLGWLGFNAGSTMAADPAAISRIIVTTNISASTGAVGAAIASWLVLTKPDLGMIINGILAGMVSVTGACAFVDVTSAVAIGFVGGMIAVFASEVFNTLKIDDPVGALPVHLVGGIWGTLAVGLFSVGPGVNPWHGADSGPSLGVFLGGDLHQLGLQLTGLCLTACFVGLTSLLTWLVVEIIFGLRVSDKAEEIGLDISEHGIEAYPEFQNR